MNWKYYIVKTASRIDQFPVESDFKLSFKHYSFGRHWIFDLKRIPKFEPKFIIDAGANIGSVSKLNIFV